MHRWRTAILAFLFPAALAAQAPAPGDHPKAVILRFITFADLFGGRLVAAFNAIPADKYGFRPTPVQQTVGFIAQHLEDANYGLCQSLSKVPRPQTSKDSVADTIKATWPRDTLVRRLDESLRYCERALEELDELTSAAVASTLLAFETDLAEHYSQVAVYMRILGLVPPSAIPLKQGTAVDVPASSLVAYTGTYALMRGVELVVTVTDGALTIQSLPGGAPVRLSAESPTAFFLKGQDLHVTFARDASGKATGLEFRRYGRTRTASKVR